MHRATHAPLVAVRRTARACGALHDAAPMRSEHARRHEVDAHRNPAPLAGQPERLGLLGDARHGDRRMWLLKRLEVDVLADARVVLRYLVAPAMLRVSAGPWIVPDIQHRVDRVDGDLALNAGARIDADDLEVAWKAA